MKKRTFTPISVLIGVLLLALVASMTLFVGGQNIAFAQQTLSDDANLNQPSLQFSTDGQNNNDIGLLPSWDPNVTSYTATTLVPYAAGDISVSATPNDSNAIITSHTDNDGDNTNGYQFSHSLGGGGSKSTLSITVRAQDGSTKTYSFALYRKRQNESTNANLSSLSLGTGTMSPGFSGSQIEYNARVANDVDKVTVSYTPSDNAGGVSVSVSAGDGASIPNATNKPNEVQLQAGTGLTKSTITVQVTPEAGPATSDTGDDCAATSPDANIKCYTIKVYRLRASPEDDANLAASNGLTVTYLDSDNNSQTAVLNPEYGATKTSYTTKVGNAISEVNITANTADNGAVARISPTDADGGAIGHQVRLSAGSAVTVTVAVTAEDTSISKTYTVKVYRLKSTPSTVSTLSALSLSAGSLTPGFSSTVTSYDARVGSNISEITVNATPTDNAGGAGVVIAKVDNANECTNTATGLTHTPKVAMNGAGSDTFICVQVTAEAGAGSNSENVDAYLVTVYRSRNAILAQANLSNLTIAPVNNGAIAYNNNISFSAEDFYALVTNPTTAVTVTPTLIDGTGATVDITPADSATTTGHQVALTAGATTTITIVVTAEDRTTTKTYTVKVYRLRATADLSDVDTLSALSLSAGTLEPAFATSKVDYKARVANSVEDVTVSATATDNAGGAVIEIGTPTTCNTTTAITHNAKVTLSEGSVTPICVRVTAEDNTAKMVYTIDVYRERVNPSENASLAAFSIAEATGTVNITTGVNATGNATQMNLDTNTGMDPNGEDPDVAYRVREITVVADASDPGAIVTIMPADSDGTRSGHQVALAEGEVTDITVTVQPEDTTVDAKTYSTSVYRKQASTRISKDATLKSLSLSGAVLTPEFDPATTKYTAAAAFSATKTIVTAMPNHIGARNGVVIAPGATTKSGWEVPLSAAGGEYTIRVTVTPETGASADAKTYTIVVTRAATAGTDATLSRLSLTDGAGMDIALTPAFDPATAAYTASVDSAVTAANVMAMATAPGTTVEVMYGADDTEVTAGDDGSYSVPLTEGANTVKVMVTAEDAETTMTYTVGITVSPSDPSLALYDEYDTDDNNMIDKSEVVAAIEAYLQHGTLTKAEVVTLIQKYLSGEPIRE